MMVVRRADTTNPMSGAYTLRGDQENNMLKPNGGVNCIHNYYFLFTRIPIVDINKEIPQILDLFPESSSTNFLNKYFVVSSSKSRQYPSTSANFASFCMSAYAEDDC